MTAREKFCKGDRVTPSDEAIRLQILHADDVGIVTGFGRVSNLLVVVRREGRKHSSSYSMEFWEREKAR